MVVQDDVLRWLDNGGRWVSIEEMTVKTHEEDPTIPDPRIRVTSVLAKLYRKWGRVYKIEKKEEFIGGPTKRGDDRYRTFYRRLPDDS